MRGSSPPVRGAPPVALPVLRTIGLIPARAGSTDSHSPTLPFCGAHPRPCGEHRRWGKLRTAHKGSSPPVRGAPVIINKSALVLGLIPARAGSTAAGRSAAISARAHPRPCGEHVFWVTCISIALGSSPPVRGARESTVSSNVRWGLIPARAGSTFSWTRHNGPVRAHPRPCGEH